MKKPFTLGVLSLNFIVICSGAAQNFHNLGFEGAYFDPIEGDPGYPRGVNAFSALPGWRAYYGTNLQGKVFWDSPAVNSACISLISQRTLEGQFSVTLAGGSYGPLDAQEFLDASLSQTKTVPTDAKWLLFKAKPASSYKPLLLSMDGDELPYFMVSTQAGYGLYASDISGYAGREVGLRFSALPNEPLGNMWTLDSIAFSTDIPQPALSMALAGTNVLLSWPSSFSPFHLEQSDDLVEPSWTSVTNSVSLTNGLNQVLVSRKIGNAFFRLKVP